MPAIIPGELKDALADLPLVEIRYFETIDSTNAHCLAWAGVGAADLSLAVADHQSAGRGRANRKWVTNPGAALAFSLILRPGPGGQSNLPYFSPLGAVAIRAALEQLHGLQGEIKWPNDVLVARKKLAGILVENAWEGQVLQAIVIGIGINITREALPSPEELFFPATCVEAETGRPVDRWRLLAGVLAGMIAWRARLGTGAFFNEWSDHLAFRDERVCIKSIHKSDLVGRLAGIDVDGDLLIDSDDGNRHKVKVGDVSLRAV